MTLSLHHPALGAFRKKKRYEADWEAIADDLAYGLQRRLDHTPPGDTQCLCRDHLALYVYDESKWRTRTCST